MKGAACQNMGKYAFGVDVGGTTVKMGLFDCGGNLLDKWEIPTRREDNGAFVLPDIAESIRKKMQEKHILAENTEGVGIGVPGAVDENGVLPGGAVNLGWGVFNISEKLGNMLQLPVKAENDANMAAYGELWQGGGKGCKSMVAVTLGTGVGGGIIINGSLLSGASGAAGEIGHIHIEDNETVSCACGKKGCLEQYASATGIVRLARRRLDKDSRLSVLRGKKVSARTVFDAVKAGDVLARETAEQFADYLGKGLAAVAAVVNPQVFVIGGGVSGAGEILLEYIKPAFLRYVFAPCQNAEFKLAMLGNDAGIFGAAGLVLGNKKEKGSGVV